MNITPKPDDTLIFSPHQWYLACGGDPVCSNGTDATLLIRMGKPFAGRGYPDQFKGTGFKVSCETSRKTRKKKEEQSCEGCQAWLKAQGLGPCLVGVRRFESGLSHLNIPDADILSYNQEYVF